MKEPELLWKSVVPKEIIGYIRKELFMFVLTKSPSNVRIHIFIEDDEVWHEQTSFSAYWFRDLDNCLHDFAKFLMTDRKARITMKEIDK